MLCELSVLPWASKNAHYERKDKYTDPKPFTMMIQQVILKRYGRFPRVHLTQGREAPFPR